MSGTSLDSVDYALCSVDEFQIRLERYWQRRFPEALRRRLDETARDASSSHEAAQLHHDLGRLYAEQAVKVLKGAELDLVGLHGQTVFHNPGRNPATLQLGEPAYLAERLRVPVVSNFRAADLAAGGEGAPLATLFHRTVFGAPGRHVCVHNLGGISNVTSIDWRRGAKPRLLAFDTGPANLLLDLAVRRFSAGKRHFDRNGSWARRGSVDVELLAAWMKHPFFRKKPPKSTGRELFGDAFLESAWPRFARRKLSRFDVQATLAEFTACSLAFNYRIHLNSFPEKVILAGGGAANADLVERIRKALRLENPKTEVLSSETFGWPIQSVEPAAFALLAYYRFRRNPANIPATTGAAHPVLLGQVTEV